MMLCVCVGVGPVFVNTPGKGEVDFLAHLYFIGLPSEDQHI